MKTGGKGALTVMEVKRSHKEMTLIKCICKKKKGGGGLDMINNGLLCETLNRSVEINAIIHVVMIPFLQFMCRIILNGWVVQIHPCSIVFFIMFYWKNYNWLRPNKPLIETGSTLYMEFPHPVKIIREDFSYWTNVTQLVMRSGVIHQVWHQLKFVRDIARRNKTPQHGRHIHTW